METAYLLALTTGLLGGFGHCIGMCGPIVASYTFARAPEGNAPLPRALTPHMLYNAGRILTYALIGLGMGLTGSFANVAGKIAGIQNIIAICSGFFMIIMGLNITGAAGSAGWIEKHNMPFLRAARRVIAWPSPFRFIPLGLLLGLLPCGLSYTVFIAAAGTGSAVKGMITASLFGIGTLPALLLFGAVVSALSARLRGRLYWTGGVVVIIMGLSFLFQGLRIHAGL